MKKNYKKPMAEITSLRIYEEILGETEQQHVDVSVGGQEGVGQNAGNSNGF